MTVYSLSLSYVLSDELHCNFIMPDKSYSSILIYFDSVIYVPIDILLDKSIWGVIVTPIDRMESHSLLK
jgi:hypothetical protein